MTRIGTIWGYGEAQELRNMYTRTAQPGLWFIAGGLAQCRINSKYLALQIKACEEGLLPRVGSRPALKQPVIPGRAKHEPGISVLPGTRANTEEILQGRNHMPTILGSGEHRYRVVENWAKLPQGWTLTDVASVAVDSKDRIYVFNRGAHPMVVFDRAGNFIKSWGEGLFHRAHGLHIDADDNLYCTDDGDHTVRKCSVTARCC